MLKRTDRVIYYHVPKTGGGSMYDLLRNYIGKNNCRYISIAECPDAELITHGGSHACYFGPFGFFKPPTGYKTITIMRDPVNRVTSYFRWLRGKDMAQHPGAEFAQGTLRQFVESRWHRIENAQVAMLSGHGQDPSRPMEDADFHRACDAVSAIDYVGSTENYRAFVVGLGLARNGDRLPMVNSTLPETYYIADLDLIAERNELDYRLYRWAEARWG